MAVAVMLQKLDGLIAKFAYSCAFVIVIGAVVLQRWWRTYSEPLFPFLVLEDAVLLVIAFWSTYNYDLKITQLRSIAKPGSESSFSLHVFMLANVSLFGVVIYFPDPRFRLGVIALIYAAFSMANYVQVQASVTSCREEHAVATLFDGNTYLCDENGPTAIAYTGAAVFCVVFLFAFSKDYTLLSAFAGGVAAFHLGLSVVKYYFRMRFSDPLQSILNSLRWSDDLNRIVSSATRWKWRILVCAACVSIVVPIALFATAEKPARPMPAKDKAGMIAPYRLAATSGLVVALKRRPQ